VISSEKELVIAKLTGGLGNQMFQYAMARRVAIVNNFTLKLDTTWFENNPLNRTYDLNHFSIIENFASQKEIKLLKNSQIYPAKKYIYRLIELGKTDQKPSHIIEKSIDYDPDVLLISNSVYLEGYWQSEKYFKDVEGIIREELNFRHKADAINSEFVEMIGHYNSVSIHVRRGDYVSNDVTNKVHGTCSLDYYNNAIDYIKNSEKKPYFFVFSDDPLWVKENLKIDDPTQYISHNINKNYEDLRLMSLCKHFIIANSSFSWWGAWLSRNPDKIVIAPRRWFKQKECNISDRLPESWIKL
jgi:hypothetical protein